MAGRRFPSQAREHQYWRTVSWALSVATVALALGRTPASAQVLPSGLREAFLADPLTDIPRDPLLPRVPIPRSLSPLEQLTLTQALDQLLASITELGLAGDQRARDLWMREVRLRRLLGVKAELAAIDRAASTLHDWNATQELQLLSARLTVLVADLMAEFPLALDQLEGAAIIYGVLGDLEAALSLRSILAEEANGRGDLTAYWTQLERMANLYEQGFYFSEAANIYQQLAAIATANDLIDDQIRFLQAQIKNLTLAQDPASALGVQQQLLQGYLSDSNYWPRIASLQYAMADNQVLLQDLDTASRQYQIAYTNAIGSQQFALAAATLERLVKLYERLGRWTDVDYLYDQLLRVHQTTSNAYGLMDSFDQLGQLYEKRGNHQAALRSYRQGLVLAQKLNHRQNYFETQIKRLTEAELP